MVVRSNHFGPKNPNQVHLHQNQLAYILTKGNFTRDEWNHLLSLFNISHFSSTVCSETMAKRLQQDSGEERVTAKSRPMMSLIAWLPSNVSSSTSVSPVKRSYGNQNPWSAIAEKEEGSARPDIGSDRKTAFDYYYHEQFMESFSQQATQSGMMTMLGLLKSGKLILRCANDRGDPKLILKEKAWPQQFVIENDEAELELSVESRSFVNRVNDQVRKRQKRISIVTEDGEKHSMTW